MVEMQIDTATLENSMEIPLKKKLRINLPSDPAIPLLGIKLKKSIIEKDACTPVFVATLFTIAWTQKQPRCPSTDERIKRQWYIYTTEYYLTIKRNAFESVLMRQMNLQPFTQSEGNQEEKSKYCILIHVCGI